jgi:hypothetical protein
MIWRNTRRRFRTLSVLVMIYPIASNGKHNYTSLKAMTSLGHSHRQHDTRENPFHVKLTYITLFGFGRALVVTAAVLPNSLCRRIVGRRFDRHHRCGCAV